MIRTLTSRRWSPIALDLGTASLQAVQLRASGSEPVLHEAVTHEARPGSAPPDPSDWRGRFERVRDLIERHRFRGRTVAIALDPPWVELRPVNLPAALLEGSSSRAEVLEAIRWEVGRALSFPVEQAEFEYWPLPPSRGDQTGAMAVAVNATVLSEMLDACRESGLTCARVDVGPCVLVAGCVQRMDIQPTDIWGVLDLGAHNNNLCVAVGDTPVYQRVVPGNGIDLTHRLAAALEIEPVAAEDLKRQFGIEATTRGHRTGACDLTKFQEEDIPGFLFSILRPTLEAMLKEIERAFGYVMQTYPDATVRCLVTTGHGARLKGLDAWLAEALGIAVPRFDVAPEATAHAMKDIRDPGMMRAFGLALLTMKPR